MPSASAQRAGVDIHGSVVLLVMAAVIFDGLAATPAWRTFEDCSRAVLQRRLPIAARTLGLVGVWLLFLGAYAAIAWIMAAATGGRLAAGEIARRFVLTLIPIVIAYHLAHYLSYLLIQGQYVIPLASDPFGRGWDLFGTAGYRRRHRYRRRPLRVVSGRHRDRRRPHRRGVPGPCAGHGAAARAPPRAEKPGPDDRADGGFHGDQPLDPRPSRSSSAPPAAAATTASEPAAAIAVPADAILPEAGSGRFQPAGPDRTARVALRYGAMTSLFHDGTRTELADILYPFAFAWRWGAEAPATRISTTLRLPGPPRCCASGWSG